MCVELTFCADLNSDALTRRLAFGVRRSAFVLVLVLVLESWRAECWSTGVSEYCAFSELYPTNVGLGLLTGRFPGGRLPRAEALGYSIRPFHGQGGRRWHFVTSY
jgi:hypothetical protein